MVVNEFIINVQQHKIFSHRLYAGIEGPDKACVDVQDRMIWVFIVSICL